MSETPRAPDLSALQIAMDSWTKPFWDAAEDGKLLAPRCADCHKFRWPPGPFCAHCLSQRVEWLSPGPARLYSFTVAHGRRGEGPEIHVPGLVEFPDANGIRILAAIIDTPLEEIQIGAALTLGWSKAVNAKVPVFSVSKPSVR